MEQNFEQNEEAYNFHKLPCPVLDLFDNYLFCVFAGLIISLLFMILSLIFSPHATQGLNYTQTSALLSNVLTLFVGIMLIITADEEDTAKCAGESFDTRGP